MIPESPDAVAVVPTDLAGVIARHDRGLEARDAVLMLELLTEDFMQVTPAGTPKGRDEWLDWFENIARYDAMRRSVVAVRTIGETVVVLSRCHPIMRVRDGEPSEHQTMMLELWTRRDGAWIKAYEQYTRPPQPAA